MRFITRRINESPMDRPTARIALTGYVRSGGSLVRIISPPHAHFADEHVVSGMLHAEIGAHVLSAAETNVSDAESGDLPKSGIAAVNDGSGFICSIYGGSGI